ncbi:MAG: VOC family protein [Sphingopyxis terrae]|nr:MAG: VOC family protein [Sphingopyxis terrae]
MFSHVTLGANDIAATKRFYDAALGALGIPVGRVDERGRLIYAHDGGRLVITKPVNGEAAACHASTASGEAASLANGGTSAEDPPGIRNATEGRVLYLAYLRDPAGNKLCAFHKISG